MKKVVLFLLVLVLLSISSCQKEDTEPQYPRTLKFEGNKIFDMYVYTGPLGDYDNTKNQSFLEKKWSRYLDKVNDYLLKVTKDSLFLVNGNLKISYLSRHELNAVYIKKGDDKWHYFGEWGNNTFVRKENFRYSRIYDEVSNDFRESFYEGIGEAIFSDLFNEDRIIKHPKELKNIGDTIAWTNIGYIYSIIE